MALSDAVLGVLAANLIVSGVLDYLRGGRGIFVRLGVVAPIRWHALSAAATLLYLVVHVTRRASRVRHSRIS